VTITLPCGIPGVIIGVTKKLKRGSGLDRKPVGIGTTVTSTDRFFLSSPSPCVSSQLQYPKIVHGESIKCRVNWRRGPGEESQICEGEGVKMAILAWLFNFDPFFLHFFTFCVSHHRAYVSIDVPHLTAADILTSSRVANCRSAGQQ